ncbi:hypothetical protein JCM30760_22230 [Thiomicrorhabdus hydrogeniphila]
MGFYSIQYSCKKLNGQKGFTLIELLIVVSILAAIAFTTTTSLQGVDSEVDDQLAQIELLEVVKAVRQFRADTGYFPKEGRFDLAATATITGNSSCESLHTALSGRAGGNPAAVLDVAVDLPAYAPASCVDKVAWFYNAANLSQLSGIGVKTSLENVMPWNSASARGWRGPYLDANAEGFVDIGRVDTDVATPTSGTVYKDVPAIFTGGKKVPQEDYYVSRIVPSDSPQYGSAEKQFLDLDWAGRPILMFVEKNTSAIAEKVVLLSMGKDGQFDGYVPNDCTPKGDDKIICIYAD